MASPRMDILSRRWKRAPRRWGHPLHSLCSYFAMFPPQIPHVFIRWLTDPGDVVYDPFSGRGTVPMEACRLGRLGMGGDANPLAHILTWAKVDPPSAEEVYERICELRRAFAPGCVDDAPDEIRMLYAPAVLEQLLWLRKALNEQNRSDRFLMATVLGLMHANYKPGSPARGLSISMPNTFSMSPAYVRKYNVLERLKPGLMRNILFIKDGPLAFFGLVAPLYKPMRELVTHLLSGSGQVGVPTVRLAGLEKSGAFVEHATAIQTHIPPGSYFMVGDSYIRRYIVPGEAGIIYGQNTYYGQKVLFRASGGEMYVVTVPGHDYLAEPQPGDIPHLEEILSLIAELRCSMYDNALIPVALANKLVSLSDFPSQRILGTFAREKLGT